VEKTLLELAELVGGQVIGDPGIRIRGLGTLETAGNGQITFLANPRYAAKVSATQASAVVLATDANAFGRNAIVVENPYLAFAKLLTIFTTRPRVPRGIMRGVIIGDEVTIGEDASIHPGTVVGDRVVIGRRVTLHPNVTLYDDVVLGDDVTLHSGVAIREGCRIGNRVIIHNGATIGSDGFGYAPEGAAYYKIPQIGIVIVEDDVEIGANSAVDRAALEVTRVGRGTKIDNLVQIGHNCVIGEDCIIVGQAGIAGSTRLGRHVTLGGQVAIAGHLTVGDGAMISGKSGVMSDVAPGEVLSGTPAMPHQARLRSAAVFPHLPQMRKSLTKLGNQMAQLEEQMATRLPATATPDHSRRPVQ
jgi:UDP-3-O-[3-hydroxymyristoyl] glucosamine N-acyltransferase